MMQQFLQLLSILTLLLLRNTSNKLSNVLYLIHFIIDQLKLIRNHKFCKFHFLLN